MKRSSILVVSALAFVIGTGCWQSSKRDASNVVISKIEGFKQAKGRLPNILSETGAQEDEGCPCYCKTGDNSYIVWYGTTLGESETYDSETKKWSNHNGVCSSTAQDFHKQLSPAEKQHILDGPFTVVMKTEDMPVPVMQAFAKIAGEPSFSLANPGQKFQVSDVVVEPRLPRRRLIFAGVHADEWLVHYEMGGIGHSYCVLLFKVGLHDRIQFVWGAAGVHSAESLDQLRKLVASGQFSDDRQYYW